MRLLHNHHKSPLKQAGFTLVEMLVVAPLALLVIAGLVGAMVSMIGDSLIASNRADTAYNVQDTLSQIEQDSRVATSFMGNFSYLKSPQGRDGGTAAFSYTSNNDLILTQQSTTTSPYNNTRQLIYFANQPAGCSGDTSANRTLFNRVVYFLMTNGDGTKSLWRRTILNPWNSNATPDGNTVCSTPWQRSSCPTGSAISTSPGATCQSIDQRMLDNVTSFVPTYYNSLGISTTNPSQASEVSVSITVSKTVSGSLVAQTSVVRASRRNDVPVTVLPSAPVVTRYNAGINSYNNPILTSVQWSAPGASTYLVSTKVGAGAWSTPTSTSNTFLSISSDPNTTISVQVTAVNDSGTSTTTTFPVPSSDLFTDLNLATGWAPYNDCTSGTFYCPSFTRTSSGLVVLRGLIKGGSGLITTLPDGFRPNKHLVLSGLGTNNAPMRIDVDTDGKVTLVGGDGSSLLSLDNIRFLSSSTVLTWTSPSYCVPGCTAANQWKDYTSGGSYPYGSVQFTKDSSGRSYLYGMMSAPTTYPPAYNSSMTTIPAGKEPAASDVYPDVSGSVYAAFDVTSTATKFRTNLGGSWKSLYAIYYPSSSSPVWSVPAPFKNSWKNPSLGYSAAQYTKGSDGIVLLHGLISSGATNSGTVIFTLPGGNRPSKELVFETAGYLSGTGEVSARVDVQPDGDVIVASSNGTISNTYLSLAGITFYAEQ